MTWLLAGAIYFILIGLRSLIAFTFHYRRDPEGYAVFAFIVFITMSALGWWTLF